MRVSYSPDYYVPLPDDHPFPMAKFPALHNQLLRAGIITSSNVVAPRPADWSDLLRVHTNDYLTGLANGTLSRNEVRRMGLPWSPQLVHRSRVAVQGTINAAFMALEDGIAANLAGGTHHAMPGHGEGFCVLNDVAVAIRLLQSSLWAQRILIIDLDVHQGNGNAAFFHEDDRVYTFSLHGERNYPFEKPPSTRDIPLPDDVSDGDYLTQLAEHLPSALDEARPDLIFYLAGIDVVEGDRFGRINLSQDTLRKRERFVLKQLKSAEAPTVLLLSGGYAHSPEQTAALHAVIHEEAQHIF